MKNFLNEFRKLLGSERVITDSEVLKIYSRSASGISGNVFAILFPENTYEVSEIVKICYKHNIPIYTQGSATELVGSAIPEKGVVISFENMYKIVELNIEDNYVVCEPGLRIGELNIYLEEFGKLFPIEPSSYKSATVGGVINSGAGSLKCIKYGSIRDWILSLEIVLPDENGTILNIGCKTIKCRQGYDLTRLIIGSEGTLAIVTKAILRITNLPENIGYVIATFKNIENLIECVKKLRFEKLNFYMIEFLDDKLTKVISNFTGTELNEYTLFIGIEYPIEIIDKYLNIVEKICYSTGSTYILKFESVEKWKQSRYSKLRQYSYPAKVHEILRQYESKNVRIITEDFVIPLSKLNRLISIIYKLSNEYKIDVYLSGHIGDGNIHPTTWIDLDDINQVKRVNEFIEKVFDYVIEFDGCISGEHGIGIIKKNLLTKEFEKRKSIKAIELMKEIKKIFDPKGILNPGKIF